MLEPMKVDGLTRHNIASHLQKYRMHRRHILPKQEERRWPHPRDSTPRNYYPHHRQVMVYLLNQNNHAFASGQVYPHVGSAGFSGSCFSIWGSPSYLPWQPAEYWPWKPYPPMHADAWGCPVMSAPLCPTSAFHVQGAYGFHSPDSYGKNFADINLGVMFGGVVLLLGKCQNSRILEFDEELFFIYFLPPIILNAGFQVKKKQFFKNFATTLSFGVLGTLISFYLISENLKRICKLI